MKKFLCLIFALLLPSNNYLNTKYYVCIIFNNNQAYEEYMTYKHILHVVGDFVEDNSIQSLHIIKNV